MQSEAGVLSNGAMSLERVLIQVTFPWNCLHSFLICDLESFQLSNAIPEQLMYFMISWDPFFFFWVSGIYRLWLLFLGSIEKTELYPNINHLQRASV